MLGIVFSNVCPELLSSLFLPLLRTCTLPHLLSVCSVTSAEYVTVGDARANTHSSLSRTRTPTHTHTVMHVFCLFHTHNHCHPAFSISDDLLNLSQHKSSHSLFFTLMVKPKRNWRAVLLSTSSSPPSLPPRASPYSLTMQSATPVAATAHRTVEAK